MHLSHVSFISSVRSLDRFFRRATGWHPGRPFAATAYRTYPNKLIHISGLSCSIYEACWNWKWIWKPTWSMLKLEWCISHLFPRWFLYQVPKFVVERRCLNKSYPEERSDPKKTGTAGELYGTTSLVEDLARKLCRIEQRHFRLFPRSEWLLRWTFVSWCQLGPVVTLLSANIASHFGWQRETNRQIKLFFFFFCAAVGIEDRTNMNKPASLHSNQ